MVFNWLYITNKMECFSFKKWICSKGNGAYKWGLTCSGNYSYSKNLAGVFELLAIIESPPRLDEQQQPYT